MANLLAIFRMIRELYYSYEVQYRIKTKKETSVGGKYMIMFYYLFLLAIENIGHSPSGNDSNLICNF